MSSMVVAMLASAVAVLVLGAGFVAGRVSLRPAMRAVEAELASVVRDLDAAQLLARTDPLTGLANRAGLWAELAGQAGRAQRWVLALVDLDSFKWINDTYGYTAGDQVLVEVGRRLSTIVAGDGLVARLGGDELVVVTDGALLWVVANQIQAALQEPVSILDGRRVPVTASVGLVQAQRGDSPRALLHSADTALRGAKVYGKNRVVAFDHSRGLVDVQTERPAVRLRKLAGRVTGVARLVAEVSDVR